LGIDGWLERIESGSIAPVISDTEAAWRDTWLKYKVDELDSASMAFVGGALADRLAWVFHSGYQAMMHRAFPFCPKGGWTSYLVAEDRSGAYPATVLEKTTEGNRLSGYKSWVAASDHVDHMVVRSFCEDHNEYVLVEREAQGVGLSSRESPGFLPELSQGFAAFDNVAVSEEQLFSQEDLSSNFLGEEPYHVLLALAAYMATQTATYGGPLTAEIVAPIHLARQLAEKKVKGDKFMKGVALLDKATTRAAFQFGQFIERENKELFLRWERDKRLVEMFTRGLEKRTK
jgi:hypothetical protein|tara:strand:- start:330 stop:1193 length:864 start_codon:yes stop_codon:yes gene_type:complete